jgi:small-conductance mechanosensitive channel
MIPLPPPETTTLLDHFSSNRIISILLVLAATIILSRLTKKYLNHLAETRSSRRILIKNFIPIINIVYYSTGLLTILFGILELPGDMLITFGVSAGVAIGFAIKDLLANVFGGLVIILTRAFNIGDKIQVGEHYGEVVSVSLLKVRIVTPDDSLINVPSKLFLETSISNANTGALDCQVLTELLLPGNIDIERVRTIAHEASYSSPWLYTPKPVAILFKDVYKETSLVQLRIRAYVHDHRYEFAFSSDVYVRIKTQLEREHLIPPGFYRLPVTGPT